MTRLLPALVAIAVLGGCGRSESGGEQRTPQPAALEGVFAGELPCSNCAAIEATLWLRPDGRFFLRQRFKDDAASAGQPPGPSTTYGLGRWSWDELAAEAVLRGAGPERRLAVRDEQHVELRVPSPLEHVLARDPTAAPFTDRVTLDGESSVSDKGAAFVECLTGLTLPVADAGAYRELRRQHRRMNGRGKVALTTVEGHLVTREAAGTTSEWLVIDELVALKPGQGCSTPR